MKKLVKTIIKKKLNRYVENKIKFVMSSDFFIPVTETKDGDIFIVAFPKSGITWMQSVVSGLLFEINTEYLTDHLAQEIVPDVHARKFYKRFSEFNFFKSHNLPQKQYRRVIYLVRDGRDALTSYYFFNKELGNNFSLEEMVTEGKGIFPSKWHCHVKKWLENPYNADIIYVRYEDLLKNPLTELQRICKFSGLERNDETLKKIIDGTSIKKMKQRAKQYGGLAHSAWKGEKGEKFFRKGTIGDYKNYFSPDILNFFNNEAKEELAKFNYL